MSYRDTVLRHLAGFFVGHPSKDERWPLGPMATDHNFSVMRYAPGPKMDCWTYCSIAADLSGDGQRLEFFALSPRADDRMVELVTMTSYYHRREILGPGHTLPIGQPWLDSSSCDCFLVSLPYTFGPELERLEADQLSVHFLWLLPITSAERQFAKTHGVEALEQRFDDAEIEYWDVSRPSVA